MKNTIKLTLLAVGCIILLSACEPKIDADQCMRSELFQKCLSSVPSGPQSTKYNDWSEVVSECGSQAYYQSLRTVKNIKPECR